MNEDTENQSAAPSPEPAIAATPEPLPPGAIQCPTCGKILVPDAKDNCRCNNGQ